MEKRTSRAFASIAGRPSSGEPPTPVSGADVSDRRGATGRLRGRGAVLNPGNRFERQFVDFEPGASPLQAERATTELLTDSSQTVLSKNDSPDLGFDYSLNPYRGCEHGCAYCYARPTHEYLGFSAGLDFETRIVVKRRAPELLRKELAKKSWQPQTVAISGVTDAYQPIERQLRVTRGCLEVFADFRNPVTIVTKSHLVTRDLDLLQHLHEFSACSVVLSVTTLDNELAARLEPRAASPKRRLDTIRQLADAGIPTGVMTAPIIPGLNDHEIPQILEAAREAGAELAGKVLLRLPYGLRDLFAEWLEVHCPQRRDKVLHLLREARQGQLNDTAFGQRMSGTGPRAQQIDRIFARSTRRLGYRRERLRLSTDHFRRRSGSDGQLGLF